VQSSLAIRFFALRSGAQSGNSAAAHPVFAMPVGLLTLELHIAEARSLKDKRQILRSLKDRLRRKFNVAVAELDFQDVWQSATVGVVTLSGANQHVEESLQHVLAEAQRILGPVLVDHSVDLL
jgi:uncharacterized protein